MVKRYEHEDKCGSEYNCGFYECNTGDYVEYADYEKLVEYAQHKPDCNLLAAIVLCPPGEKPKCDCGFEQALESEK